MTRIFTPCPPRVLLGRRGRRQGQIALTCLVLMGFMLVLVRMILNLGEMAQVRTETSNASDAGALAAASWIASGQNEAAEITQKMWNSINLVQALYIPPYCPGVGRVTYARTLWRSLAKRVGPKGLSWNYGPYVIRLAGIPGPPGPPPDPVPGEPPPQADALIPWLREVADDAMIAAWNLGRREWFTAAINNMMIRYNVGLHDLGLFHGDESVAQDIEQFQKDLQSGMTVTRTNLILVGPDWHNGLDPSDPMYLSHKPKYEMHYPRFPPNLEMASLSAPYWQYEGRTEALDAGAPFDYEFVAKEGVRNFWPHGGPVVELPPEEQLPENPLEVDINGRKLWDLDLTQIIPSVSDLDIGVCDELVSGLLIARTTTTEADMMPFRIENGNGEIVIAVSHEVLGATGTTNIGGAILPEWTSRFPPVGSEATAQYTAANIPNPDAKAKLTGTQ